jgi:hypothetical protein
MGLNAQLLFFKARRKWLCRIFASPGTLAGHDRRQGDAPTHEGKAGESWENKIQPASRRRSGFPGFRSFFSSPLSSSPRVAVGGVFREVCNDLAVALH